MMKRTLCMRMSRCIRSIIRVQLYATSSHRIPAMMNMVVNCISSFQAWLNVFQLNSTLPGFIVLLGFPRLLESAGIFIGKFSGPGKSWKMTLVLESLEVSLQGPGICLALMRTANAHWVPVPGSPQTKQADLAFDFTRQNSLFFYHQQHIIPNGFKN